MLRGGNVLGQLMVASTVCGGVDCRREARSCEVVGAKAKESSVEIGAIVPGPVGLQNGDVGISGDGIGDATINPGADQSCPAAYADV